MCTKVLNKVETTIIRHKLLASKEQVLIALSGGADSVALLRVLVALGYRPHALHCNFRLRGDESDTDEVFVVQLCQTLGIPISIERFDTQSYARERGISIEMAARELRYGWFAHVKQNLEIDRIAVAHNADDKVETFLLNLSMGTGIRGLSGMPYLREDGVIRPLMDCTRYEIEEYLRDLGQPFRHDSSNDDTVYRRNFLRHQIIPLFRELNPSFGEAVSRSISQLRGVEAHYLDSIRMWRDRVETSRGIHIPTLEQSPDKQALLFEILYPIGFRSDQVRTLAEKLPDLSSGRKFESDTHSLQRGGDFLEIRSIGELAPELESLIIDISKRGSVSLPYGRLEWEHLRASELSNLIVEPSVALFDADLLLSCAKHLIVRHRKVGDRLYPYGMKGSKKISRIFIDNHCGHIERERAYLLCLNDEPIWLMGMVADRRYRITDRTKIVIRFCFHYKEKDEG